MLLFFPLKFQVFSKLNTNTHTYTHTGYLGGFVVKNLPTMQELQETWV